ncbi:MAG: Cys-tRNA(Pro)/Cys-tRNA(Cys) deacylase [Planctomycetota bacterium]
MAKKQRQPGGTPATSKLTALGLKFELLAYDPGALEGHVTLGEAVAHSLGIDPARMFKTLIALVDGEPVCAIVPTSCELSLKALAKAAGGKRAEMADPVDAERWTGYVTGGISPVGQTKRIPRFVDASCLDHDRIVVSAGKRGLQIELAPADLMSASEAEAASIAAPGDH